MTKDTRDTICQKLAEGLSLRSICRDEDMPTISTVLLAVVQDRDGFSEQYMQAREAAGFAHADRVADLACIAAEEGIDPQAARAAMDGFKWAAERMAPKRHSQRQEIDHTTKGERLSQPIDASKLSDTALQELMNVRNSSDTD